MGIVRGTSHYVTTKQLCIYTTEVCKASQKALCKATARGACD